MTAGRVHLFYGLSGSGKSTLARRLCHGGAAVRFTLDEWMIRLYPELSYDHPAYGQQAELVRELIWTVAEQVLATGADAVLDWNSWSQARRAWAVQRARAPGAEVVLHWLTTGEAEANRRLASRAVAGTPYARPEEGCRIVRH